MNPHFHLRPNFLFMKKQNFVLVSLLVFSTLNIYAQRNEADAIIKLDGMMKGSLSIAEFQKKVEFGLETEFVFLQETKTCKVTSFRLWCFRPDAEKISVQNEGNTVTNEAGIKLIEEAQVGDRFIFAKVLYKCKGDKEARKGNLVQIKIE